MFSFRPAFAIPLTLALLASPAFASHVRRAPTAGTTHKSVVTHRSHRASVNVTNVTRSAPRARGQQSIDPDRATQIQQALIREHYLTGDPTGRWDADTMAAMQKYQADNGWQTKLMPDGRALKKLGLGPDYSGAINAQSARFSEPPPVSTIPASQAAGFTDASGVHQ